MMTDLEVEKQSAAAQAVSEVESGMVVGLGTGSTALFAISEIARRMAFESLQITATATSIDTQRQAERLNIPLRPMHDFAGLDLAIDGADEVDEQLNLIKGAGGALFREKIVAAAASRMIVIVDSSKVTRKLGNRPVPVEVHPFALAFVTRRLQDIGALVNLRYRGGVTYQTEQSANILDAQFHEGFDPVVLDRVLSDTPGVLAHGLFIDMVSACYVGFQRGVKILTTR